MLEKLALGFDHEISESGYYFHRHCNRNEPIILVFNYENLKFGSFSCSEPAFGTQRKLDNPNC
jgi:hypothetical protein